VKPYRVHGEECYLIADRVERIMDEYVLADEDVRALAAVSDILRAHGDLWLDRAASDEPSDEDLHAELEHLTSEDKID
jgi:hypothetical protein